MIKRKMTFKQNLIAIGAILFALLVLFFSDMQVQASVVDGGSCGADLTWSLSNGVLTIEGTGAMYDFDDTDFAPWYHNREDIKSVSLPEGLYSVGDFAFYECTNLTSISLPSTVASVGEKSFMECTSLKQVTTGNGIISIEESAFHGCTSLKTISLPSSLRHIGFRAFYRCESLVSITVPSSVSSMGETVFAYCTSLIQANIQASITKLPTWTFYSCYSLKSVTLSETITSAGENSFYDCNNLQSIYYTLGEETTKETLLGNLNINQDVSVNNPSNSNGLSTSLSVESGETSTTTKVEDNDDVFIQSESVYEGGTLVSNQYDVVIKTQDGWTELTDSLSNQFGSVNTQVDIVMGEDITLTKEVLTELAGKDITLKITTSDGGIWQIACSEIDVSTLKEEYDLSFTVERIEVHTDLELAAIGNCDGYSVYFAQSFELPLTVSIPLDSDFIKENATLYLAQDIEMIQVINTVIIDNQGYATYTIGNVLSDIEYVVGINSLAIGADETVVPETLEGEYGDSLEYVEPVQYEIVGRTSSLGIDLNQFTWIIIGLLVLVITIVGVIMLVLNKMKVNKMKIKEQYSEEKRDE